MKWIGAPKDIRGKSFIPTRSRKIRVHGWVIAGSLIALAGGLLGALYPALKAARKDPIDALSYE